jgi:hypothetical protein
MAFTFNGTCFKKAKSTPPPVELVSDAIRDLKKKDLTPSQPTRGVAVAADMAETLQLQKGMDIIYQAKLEKYLDRKDTLEQNLTEAYALIFSNFCNKTMQNRIEEHPDYETMI